jgi:hypothetical protein
VGISNLPDRRTVAVVVTTDGRRVHLPIEPAEVPVLSLIRSILVGIERLLGLLAGDRRDHGGTRRRDRS